MRSVFALLLLGCTLSAGAGATPHLPERYCVGATQDGIEAYWAANSSDVARDVIRGERVVLRDYSSQRFRVVRASEGACAQEEELRTSGELSDMIAASVSGVGQLLSEPSCEVALDGVSGEEGRALLSYLTLAGLRVTSVGTHESFDPETDELLERRTTVWGYDSCETIESVVAALLRYREELL